MSKGYDMQTAQQMAYKSLDGIVLKQSYIMAYTDAFHIVGLVMLCTLPLIYLHQFKKDVRLPMDAH
jgi:DHA2 family multidrug resistance protein